MKRSSRVLGRHGKGPQYQPQFGIDTIPPRRFTSPTSPSPLDIRKLREDIMLSRRLQTFAAGLIAAFFAVAAERKPLEQVARPLAFVDD